MMVRLAVREMYQRRTFRSKVSHGLTCMIEYIRLAGTIGAVWLCGFRYRIGTGFANGFRMFFRESLSPGKRWKRRHQIAAGRLRVKHSVIVNTGREDVLDRCRRPVGRPTHAVWVGRGMKH